MFSEQLALTQGSLAEKVSPLEQGSLDQFAGGASSFLSWWEG